MNKRNVATRDFKAVYENSRMIDRVPGDPARNRNPTCRSWIHGAAGKAEDEPVCVRKCPGAGAGKDQPLEKVH
jgi:hypothetical protein